MIINSKGLPDQETLSTTQHKEMAAFDQLDPRLREFIRNMPVSFASEDVLMCQQAWGVEKALEMGQEILKANFPGWTPI